MRPPALFALACAACATTGLAPDEDCASLADAIGASRARGDDEAADLAVERLARACPDASARVLVPAPASRVQDPSLVYVDYEIDLPAGDHLTRLAVTYAGRRVNRTMAIGTGEMKVAADLVPAGGRPVHLTWTRAMAVTEPELLVLTVKLRRGTGDRPFVLDVVLPPGTKLRTMGTVGHGGGSERPKLPAPVAAEPTFEAPPELRATGATPTRFVVCPTPEGTVRTLGVEYGEPLPHPRHLGTALDWLRLGRYQMPPPNQQGRWWCILRTVRWDRAERPAVEDAHRMTE